MRAAIRRLVAASPTPVRRAYNAARTRWRNFGWTYACPVCGSRLNHFEPFGEAFPVFAEKRIVGGGLRANGVCPVCYAIDRERMIYVYLAARRGLLPAGGAVLHIAPERRIADFFRAKKNVFYVKADFVQDAADVKLDIQRLPFSDAVFDLIICSHVLEHVRDDMAAISEFHRVLKPGGRAILQVPLALALEETYEDWSICEPVAREEAFGQWDHVRLYGRDYPRRLEAGGFFVEALNWRERPDIFGRNARLYGFDPDEDLHVATKPRAAGSTR